MFTLSHLKEASIIELKYIIKRIHDAGTFLGINILIIFVK